MKIVIDTSAVVAVALREEESEALLGAMEAADERWMSALSVLELEVVLSARHVANAPQRTDELLDDLDVRVIAFSVKQSCAARRAYQSFGKGRHPAGLNLGDCCAYALSKSSGHPLLFKGGDFGKTDVQCVAY